MIWIRLTLIVCQGPFIVHSVNDPLVRGVDYDIDQVRGPSCATVTVACDSVRQQIVIVKDNFHDLSTTIAAGLQGSGYDGVNIFLVSAWPAALTPSKSLAAPSPKAGIINGIGVYNCSYAPKESICTENSPPEITLPASSRVRLRLINAASHGAPS